MVDLGAASKPWRALVCQSDKHPRPRGLEISPCFLPALIRRPETVTRAPPRPVCELRHKSATKLSLAGTPGIDSSLASLESSCAASPIAIEE